MNPKVNILFRNRIDAGLKLVELLKSRDLTDPLVLAIPRGGVVIGAVLAKSLGAELDVVLSRKLRAPYQPELAIGAISEDGQIYVNSQGGLLPTVTGDSLAQERRFQLREIERRIEIYRRIRPQAEVAGRSVIMTDDGIATGSTMVAALQTIQAHTPHELIVAVPVAPPESVMEIEKLGHSVICLSAPSNFSSVGQFYENFSQVTDEEVCNLLLAYSDAAQKVG